jgi:hypothetical protein
MSEHGLEITDCQSESAIDFVKHHSYFSFRKNDSFWRLVNSCSRIDPPPIALFSSKLFSCLPFHDKTKHLFTESDRSIFLETFLVEPGALIPASNGQDTPIEVYHQLPKKSRTFILKYAGGAKSGNYGGRKVFRLKDASKEACKKLIGNALEESTIGHHWIMQEECPVKTTTPWPLNSNSNAIGPKLGYSKTSCYCLGQKLLAAEIISSTNFKVGGSKHNVLTACIFESFL